MDEKDNKQPFKDSEPKYDKDSSHDNVEVELKDGEFLVTQRVLATL